METPKIPVGVTKKSIFLFLLVPSIWLCILYKYYVVVNNTGHEIIYAYNGEVENIKTPSYKSKTEPPITKPTKNLDDHHRTKSQDKNKKIKKKVLEERENIPLIGNITLIDKASNFLLYNSKCSIPNLNPWNHEVKHLTKKLPYVHCAKQQLLTYVSKNKNNTEAFLHIRSNLIKSYTKNQIYCCVSNVTRHEDPKEPELRDKIVDYSVCRNFTSTIEITNSTVVVRCRDKKTHKEIYKNAHSPVTIYKEVEEKIGNIDKTTRALNILFIGIDSISRLNLRRTMPQTLNFLLENNWLELQTYNKMADNTFPNLMAMLTGMNDTESFKQCAPKTTMKMENCKNFLWYEFRKRGYVTAYAEDEPDISTFNYKKVGFFHPPTDYYFRPYTIAAQNLSKVIVDDMVHCAGPQSFGERIFDIIVDFANTFNKTNYMGFFWMNSFSHNKLNNPSRMDRKVRVFLDTLKDQGIYENTAVFFISDHGMRFGDIALTYSGWLEERLPYFFIWIPQWFREIYAMEYENMRLNSFRLTNPFDIYMTIQDILSFSDRNYTVQESRGCPQCKSLFNKHPFERSCEESGIPPHWCSCENYVSVNPSNETIQAAAKELVKALNVKITTFKDGSNCAKFSLKEVSSARISDYNAKWSHERIYLLLIVRTFPNAIFEGTIEMKDNNKFLVLDDFSRLDRYYNHSKCVDSNVKLYCYCQN